MGSKYQEIEDFDHELLPEGLSAADFIEYDLIRLTKPTKYRKDEVPLHDLFGDKGVIRRELLEDEPIEHSELWLKIVSKLNPELLPRKNEKTNTDEEYLPCHLVDEPMCPRLLPSVLPRTFFFNEDAVIGKPIKKEDELNKKTPMFDFEALDKLKETINWLKFCEEDAVDDTDSD